MQPTTIDASPTYQPNAGADAAELRDAGITRAVLKASEGQTWPDPGSDEAAWYAPTVAALRAAGIETETYHLTHDNDDITLEIANLRRIVGHDPGAAIWVDVETTEDGAKPMGTHTRELIAALEREFPGVPVGRYDNRSTDGAVGPYDAGERVWLAWPGWAGESLPTAVLRVQTGRVDIGASTYDVNVDITPAPANPAPEPQPAPAPTGTVPAGQVVRPPTIDLRPLTPDVRGPGVRALQTLLAIAGYSGVKADGIAGPITRAALGRFQSLHQLAVDYIAGPATWTALVTQ